MDNPIPLGVYVEDGSSPAVLSDEEAQWEWSEKRSGAPTLDLKLSKGCTRPPLQPTAEEPHLGASNLEGERLDNLARAGWAVLFGPQTTDDVKNSLADLIAFRRSQVGNENKDLFQIFDTNHFPYKKGQSAEDWLADMGIAVDAQVQTDAGVPFYVMIVASPEDIPFQFQYDLDVYWGVGRLWLEKPEDYVAYGKAVIENETNFEASVRKELRVFAPRFDNDKATQMVCDKLVEPLMQRKMGADYGFRENVMTGKDAKRDALLDLYAQRTDRPAIYFAASHGVLCKSDGKLLSGTMGAILGQDWAAGDTPREASYVASRHVKARNADLRGTFHVLCACYGAGWPVNSSYDGTKVADAASVARLPQTILSRGGLGVLGHIDRAWSYSYVSGAGINRTAEYESIITRLMGGARAGHVTDAFNMRWNVLAGKIAYLERKQLIESPEQYHNLWVEHDDARGYVLLGDPAARLNVEKMS